MTPAGNGKRGDLGDLLYVLLRHRRFLIANTLSVTLLVLVVTLFLPVSYRATATLLPPQKEGEGLLGLGALLESFDITRLAITGATSSAQIYVAILKSRTIADTIVEEFDLVTRYRAKNAEVARKRLARETDVRLASTGVIQVSVQDRDRETAAKMANAYVAHLDAMNRTIRMGEGKRTRLFVEGRLAETTARLEAATDSLEAFQEAHPAMALPADVAASADAAADLMARRIALGVELEVLRGSLLPGAAPLVRKEAELRALDRELERLPASGMELVRRFRDYKVQEKVFGILTAQYEEARIRENKDVTTVEVLDVAVPPVRKSAPRRGILTGIAFLFSLAAGLLLVAGLEAFDALRLGEDARFRALVRPGSALDRILFGRGRSRAP